MNHLEFPTGWNEARLKAVLQHYAQQTEAEQFLEIEDAVESHDTTLIAVPNEFVPEIKAFLARKQATA